MKKLGKNREQRRRQALGFVAVVALLAAAGIVLPGGYAGLAQWAGGWRDQLAGTRLTLATSAERGALADMGQQLSDTMARNTSYPLDPIPTPDSGASLSLLAENRAQFATVSAVQREGIGETLGLARLAPQYVHVIVPSGDAPTTFRDLSGLRLGVGAASGDAAMLARQILAFLNLDQAPELITDHSADLEEAFLQGQIDAAFVLAAPFDNAVEALFATGWYRLLPLGDASTLALQFPGLRAEVLPSGLYGKSRDVPPGGTLLTTLSVDTLLVAAPDTPARYVGPLLSALHDAPLRATTRLNRLSEAESRAVQLTNLHPAAAAYYDRGAPLSSEDFYRIFSGLVLLGLVAAVLYAIWAWDRAQAGRRMERAFLAYFDQLGKIGEAIEISDDIGELSQQLLDLSVMQRQAEYEWQHHRLSGQGLDRLISLLATRTHMAYSKIQILLMAGESGTAAVAASTPSRFETAHTGNMRIPGGETPHTRGEAERTETPQSEIRTPNTFFIKTEEGVSELASEHPRAPERPQSETHPAPKEAASPDKDAKITPFPQVPPRPQRPVTPPEPAPEAATPEWVASFEDLGPEIEVDEEGDEAGDSHSSRPMDPRQASANLYPTSVRLSAAMEKQMAEGESGFRWLNTGVGESLSVPRPRKAREEAEDAPDAPEAAPDAPEATPTTPAPEHAPSTSDAEADVELDADTDYEPVVQSSDRKPAVEEKTTSAEAGEEGAAAPSEASRTSRAASGGTRAPKERGNRRRKKKARKKEQPGDAETKESASPPQPSREAKPKDDDDQMSFF